MNKGQFLIISAVVAGLIIITLSASISNIQSQRYEPSDLGEHINQLRDEAERITADGGIDPEERRNFRKMTGFVEGYEVKTNFNNTENCVKLTIQNTEQRAETPCIN